MQFKMLENYVGITTTLLIWYMQWPAQFWQYTKEFSLSKFDQGTVKFDLLQGMLMTLFLMAIDYLISIPLDLFS